MYGMYEFIFSAEASISEVGHKCHSAAERKILWKAEQSE